MTVKILRLLFLFTACFLYAHSESQWATKEAEEEEEDELNVVSSNESFKRNPIPRTLSYRNSSDSPEESDDISWIPDSGHNFSDSDILSLSGEENGIEPEDDAHPSPVLERPSELQASSSQLDDDQPSSSSLPSEFDDRLKDRQSLFQLSSSTTNNVQPSSLWPVLHHWSRSHEFPVAYDVLDSQYISRKASCSLAEDGCDYFSRTVADASETNGASVPASHSLVPLEKEFFQSTTTVDSNSSPLPSWNTTIPRTSGNQTRDVLNESDVGPTSEETSTAQTSENLILVERTSDSKSNDASSNDSAKTKRPKNAGPTDSDRPFRTLSKVHVTSLGTESEKDPVEESGSGTDFLFENISTTSGTTSSDGHASTAQEAEYVIAISDKIITPTVEYVYYVNQTSEKGKSTEVFRTEASVSRTSPGVAVSTDIDTASLSGTFLLPSFSESRSATASEAATQEGHGATPALSASTAEGVSATSVQWSHHSSATAAADGAAPSEAEEAGPPPRLSNPSCASLPVCVGVSLPGAAWPQFCAHAAQFQQFLAHLVGAYSRRVRAHQVVLDAPPCVQSDLVAPSHVAFAFYVVDESGEYEEVMTEFCGVILRKGAAPEFKGSVMEVRLFAKQQQEEAPLQLPAHPLLPEVNSGFVAAVTVSSVAGVALCLLCVLLVVVKQRLLAAGRGGSPGARASPSDDYSLDSLSINASFRRRRGAQRRSARSYLNHAFADQEIASHPLSEKDLVDCLKDKEFLKDEFKKIPMNTAKFDEIPEGADVKNRYSNVLPKPETRVILAEPSGDPLKSYINANYVKGHDGKPLCYVACQAPLPEGGVEDFWRMVWEQQSRVIVMLTMFEENGVSRCASYFPQSSLVTLPPFGDFQISLLKKEVYEFYTMSTFRLFDLERNLFREVTHLWYMMWPAVGVPSDPSNLVTFLLQCRPFINCNSGPTVVHCSTGTGRTGVVLALDICMREYDDSRSVDILRCVTQLRRDRGGAVQNKDQYILIHEAMLEYASRIANQSQRPSIRSNS